MITHLDHVQLAMPAGKEDEARAFYSELLGLTEVEKPEPLKSRGGVWFQENGFGFHLGVMKDFQPATKAHPAFCVNDLTTLFRQLKAAKIKVKWDESLKGVTRFYANDPFGNRLEFLTHNGLVPQENDKLT